MTILAVLSLTTSFLFVFLLHRVGTDAGDRSDTQYFSNSVLVSAIRTALLACAIMGGWDIRSNPIFHPTLATLGLASTYWLMLFSYSFPFNQIAPRTLRAAALVPSIVLSVLLWTARFSRTVHMSLSFAVVVPQLIASVWYQYRNHQQIRREAGAQAATPVRLVQFATLLPWVLALGIVFTALIRRSAPTLSVVMTLTLFTNLLVVAGIAIAVLRYHLLAVQTLAKQMAAAFLGSALYSIYLVLGTSPLFHLVRAHAGEVLALATVTLVPPLLGRTVWLALQRYADKLSGVAGASTPDAWVRQSLAETSSFGAATDLVPMVAKTVEKISSGTVRFATMDEQLAMGEQLPAALKVYLQGSRRPFFAHTQTPDLPKEVGTLFRTLDVNLIVPVRNDDTLFGCLLVRAGRLSRDVGNACAAIADHLGTRLQNKKLYAEILRRQRDLEHARRFLHDLVQSLPVGVAVLDGQDIVTAWSPALEQRTQVSSDNALGRSLFDHPADVHPSEPVRALIHEVRRDSHAVTQRASIPYPRGFLDVTVAPFHGSEGDADGVVVISHDVTERVQLQQQLEEARRLAALGAFAAAIAHDIRTPLTSIQMNVQMLCSRQYLLAQDREGLDIALEEIRRLTRFIGDILDYAKPLQLEIAPHDVSEVIDDVLRTERPLMEERSLVARKQIECSGTVVYADARRLRQVLVNLVDNAVSVSKRGGEIVFNACATDSRLQISVRDSGPGVPCHLLERIFDPFFTTRPDGTGLGLAIARKIVHAHDGEIAAHACAEQPGTTFTIEIPLFPIAHPTPNNQIAQKSFQYFQNTTKSAV